MDLKPILHGTVEHAPGAINLHPYPALAYAPHQHGEGIRFAHNGRPVEDALKADIAGESDLVAALDRIAAHCGVSFGDVCDALKYLRDRKAV